MRPALKLLTLSLVACVTGIATGATSGDEPPEVGSSALRPEYPALSADFQARRYDAVLEKLDRIERRAPPDVELLNFRGAVFAEQQRFEEAREQFKKALAIDAKAFWPRYNLAEVDFMERRYDLARSGFWRMLADFPQNDLVQFKVILCDLMRDDFPRARAGLQQMKFPCDSAAYYFAHAAWEVAHGNSEGAHRWISEAGSVFGDRVSPVLVESLSQLGWMPDVRAPVLALGLPPEAPDGVAPASGGPELPAGREPVAGPEVEKPTAPAPAVSATPRPSATDAPSVISGKAGAGMP